MLDFVSGGSYCFNMSLRTNGAAIRALRQAYGWKVVKFAQAIGVSRSYMSNLEAGRRQASPEVLRKISETLNVPLAAITGDHRLEDVA